MTKVIKKKLLLFKWELESRMPKPVRHWREFLKHPLKKRLLKNQGLEPKSWGRTDSSFICLCCKHIGVFREEGDLDTAPALGYYVCDKKGCGRTATHELFPGMKKRLEEIDF